MGPPTLELVTFGPIFQLFLGILVACFWGGGDAPTHERFPQSPGNLHTLPETNSIKPFKTQAFCPKKGNRIIFQPSEVSAVFVQLAVGFRGGGIFWANFTMIPPLNRPNLNSSWHFFFGGGKLPLLFTHHFHRQNFDPNLALDKKKSTRSTENRTKKNFF